MIAGVARRDITPPLGIYARNWGAAAHDTAEDIHRPLTLTALVLSAEPSEPPLVLAALDLGWWRTADDEQALRRGAADALGLDPERFLIALSHTHAGPVLCRADADRPGGEHIAPYLDTVRDALIDAVQAALSSAVPARIAWGDTRCALARHRDFVHEGAVLVGFNPDGPHDDTLTIGRCTRTDDGSPLAVLVHYACHPTVLGPENRRISPDYIGALRETVETHTGAPCLFLQGASGDLAAAEQHVPGTALVERHGRTLGFAALSALEQTPLPNTVLRFARRVDSGAALALWERVPRTDTPTTVALTRHTLSLPLKRTIGMVTGDSEGPAARERARRAALVRRTVGDGPETAIPFWRLTLGDADIIALPGEAYQSFQTALRAQRPARRTLVVNIVNGWYGYFPPAEIYPTDAYAAQQSPFAPGCHEALLAAVRHALSPEG